MEAKMGMNEYANLYEKKAAQLKQTIQRKYWDPVKKMYADTEEQIMYSQHANSLAILTGMVKTADMRALGKRMQEDLL